jgi:hypothetical protein
MDLNLLNYACVDLLKDLKSEKVRGIYFFKKRFLAAAIVVLSYSTDILAENVEFA